MKQSDYKKIFYKLGIYPVRLYWYIFRPRRYGVKCIITNEKGEILFIKNTYGSGKWNLPGGGIEKRETADEAVRREVREEVSLELQAVTPLGKLSSVAEYKKDEISIFFAKVTNPILTLQDSEISDHVWKSPEELPTPLSNIAVESFKLYIAQKL